MNDFGPFRSYLYVPGNRPELLAKALRGATDAVVLDLEDAVPAGEKDVARRIVAEELRRSAAGGQTPALLVRINGSASGLAFEDITAVVCLRLAGIRVPKVETAEEVQRIAGWIEEAEARAGLLPGVIRLQLGIENARGVLAAADLAVDARVSGVVFGAVDLAADLALEVSTGGAETLVARSLLVLSSSAAGFQPPVESVYPWLHDLDGLRIATETSRRIGFFGRSAVHPAQVPIINEVFTPQSDEVSRARTIVERLDTAFQTGSGALQLPDGSLIDLPVARQARQVIRLAEKLGERTR